MLAWLAGQEDLVSSFRKKEDVYVKMASTIYDVPESAVTKEQRFVGKTTILGAGYGMGALRFKDQLRSFGFDMDEAEAKRVIGIYRETNDLLILPSVVAYPYRYVIMPRIQADGVEMTRSIYRTCQVEGITTQRLYNSTRRFHAYRLRF